MSQVRKKLNRKLLSNSQHCHFDSELLSSSKGKMGRKGEMEHRADYKLGAHQADQTKYFSV